MTDGSGERGVSKGRKSSQRERPGKLAAGAGKAQATKASNARGHAHPAQSAGPPKFLNRIPSRVLRRVVSRSSRLDYIPLTRVRPFEDAMRLATLVPALGPAGMI